MTTKKGSSGFWYIEGVEELQLFRGDCRKAVEGALANFGRMALDAFKQIECGARACAVTLGLQAHAHDAIEDEREETDHGVSADAIGQPVMHRRDLDIRFQNAKAAFDIP